MKALIVFLYRHNNFRIPEVLSIIEAYSLKIKIEHSTYDEDNIYVLIDAKDVDSIKILASRCILIKYIIQIFAHAKDFTHALLSAENSDFGIDKSRAIKISLNCFKLKFTQTEIDEYVDAIYKNNFINYKVSLKSPDEIVMILFNNDLKESLQEFTIVFGRLLCSGQALSHIEHRFSLKTRPFLGNSSLDPVLSFLLCNLAQIVPGGLVYDPFAGSGSVLVSASYFKSFVFGSDYNLALMAGKTKPVVSNKLMREPDENIEKNFNYYNLINRFLGVISSDIFYPPFRDIEIFDAIITDPPYGVREVIRSNEKPSPVDAILGLIKISSNLLKIGGFLAFFYFFDHKQTPNPDLNFTAHDKFTVKFTCQEKVHSTKSRMVIVMQKYC